MWYTIHLLPLTVAQKYIILSAQFSISFLRKGHMTENHINMNMTQIIFNNNYNYTNINIVGT